MKRFCLTVVAMLLLSLFLSAPLWAGSGHIKHHRQTTVFVVKDCAPFTIDGTQVSVSGTWDGKCDGKAKISGEVADPVLEALCNPVVQECVVINENTDPKVRERYEELKAFAHPAFDDRRCIQTNGKTWLIEMVTGVNVPCSPANNAIRSYDLILDKACVRSAGQIMCVPMTEKIRAYVNELMANARKLPKK